MYKILRENSKLCGVFYHEVMLANQKPKGNIISAYKHMGISVEMWKFELETEFDIQDGFKM